MQQFAWLAVFLLPPWLQAAEFHLNPPSPNIESDLTSLTKSLILTPPQDPQSQLIASELLRPICIPGDIRTCLAFSMSPMSQNAANLHSSMIASMSSTQMLRTFELVEICDLDDDDDDQEGEGDECRIEQLKDFQVQIVKFGENVKPLNSYHKPLGSSILAFDLPLLRVQLTDSTIAANLAAQYLPKMLHSQEIVVADQSFHGLHREILKLMEAEPQMFQVDLYHSRTLQVLKAAQV